MRIQVFFQFKTDPQPKAFTGVEDHVTDLLLPSQGDLVTHHDVQGKPFTGRVVERAFSYDIPPGPDVNGVVSVTLFLDRVTLQ